MTIEFHCQHCGKLVRTGEEHAGKRGQCPYCHNSVYIPTPAEKLEPLKLTPVDATDERRRKALLDESRDLTQRILHERETPTDAVPPVSAPPPVGDVRLITANMESLVIQYAQCMARGDLAQAQELAGDIRLNLRAADEVVQRLMADDIPRPELAGIPRPVLTGFFRQLREKK